MRPVRPRPRLRTIFSDPLHRHSIELPQSWPSTCTKLHRLGLPCCRPYTRTPASQVLPVLAVGRLQALQLLRVLLDRVADRALQRANPLRALWVSSRMLGLVVVTDFALDESSLRILSPNPSPKRQTTRDLTPQAATRRAPRPRNPDSPHHAAPKALNFAERHDFLGGEAGERQAGNTKGYRCKRSRASMPQVSDAFRGERTSKPTTSAMPIARRTHDTGDTNEAAGARDMRIIPAMRPSADRRGGNTRRGIA